MKKKTKKNPPAGGAPKNVPIYKYPQDLATKKGVNGLGLFAKVSIKKGDCIIEYIGEIIDNKEANRRGGKYLFQTSANRHLDGKGRDNIARYINHSCKPNCEADTIRGRVFISAIKNISAGEELNYDYGKEYWDEHIKPKGCLCVRCVEKRKINK